MIEALKAVVEAEPHIAYAIVFGSRARGTAHSESDVDVAVGLTKGTRLTTPEMGELISRLETAAGGSVDLVILDEAAPALAYRVFREGNLVLERDHEALARRKARAILEYLDFRPVEELCARGVLAAAASGR